MRASRRRVCCAVIVPVMAATPDRSALVVLVPPAEAVVAPGRARLDPSARLGVPAHVTVLSPFASPADLTPEVLDHLRRHFSEEPSFRLHLSHLAWFEERVLYCAAEPRSRLTGLTERAVSQWPTFQPYGGAYDALVPHLTIGQDAPLGRLHEAAVAVEPRLPVEQPVVSVHLMIGSDEPSSWSVAATFPLAARAGAPRSPTAR